MKKLFFISLLLFSLLACTNQEEEAPTSTATASQDSIWDDFEDLPDSLIPIPHTNEFKYTNRHGRVFNEYGNRTCGACHVAFYEWDRNRDYTVTPICHKCHDAFPHKEYVDGQWVFDSFQVGYEEYSHRYQYMKVPDKRRQCLKCHGTTIENWNELEWGETYHCADCHIGYPHQGNWMAEHGKSENIDNCYRCHGIENDETRMTTDFPELTALRCDNCHESAPHGMINGSYTTLDEFNGTAPGAGTHDQVIYEYGTAKCTFCHENLNYQNAIQENFPAGAKCNECHPL